jgi:hypothetical protein
METHADEAAQLDAEQRDAVIDLLHKGAFRPRDYHEETLAMLARNVIDGISLRDLAAELGMQRNAVRDRLNRAKRILKAAGLWADGLTPTTAAESEGGDYACGQCGKIQRVTELELARRFRPRCKHCGGHVEPAEGA